MPPGDGVTVHVGGGTAFRRSAAGMAPSPRKSVRRSTHGAVVPVECQLDTFDALKDADAVPDATQEVADARQRPTDRHTTPPCEVPAYHRRSPVTSAVESLASN